jgi:hypothetical protein
MKCFTFRALTTARPEPGDRNRGGQSNGELTPDVSPAGLRRLLGMNRADSA